MNKEMRNFVDDGRHYIWLSDSYPTSEDIVSSGVISYYNGKGSSKEILENILDKWQLEFCLKDLPASYFIFNSIRSLCGSCGIAVVQDDKIVSVKILGRS